MKRSAFKAKSYQWKRTELKRVPGTARTTLKLGKKSKAWAKTRRKLKQESVAQGIERCELRYEGCWGDNGLGYAHGRKRRHLQGDELKTLTILVCNSCHDKIEYLGPERMLEIVETVIANREREAA